MTYSIKNQINLGNKYCLITIELNPESEFEKQAIKKSANLNASVSEREMLENYLHFCLGNSFSLLKLEQQEGNIFTVKAFQN